MSMYDILCGLMNAITVFSVSASAEHNPVWSLILTIVSSVVYVLLNLVVRVITSALEKKGVITPEHKREIDDIADDLGDDGKRNHSNK